jgi:hypothetical protein
VSVPRMPHNKALRTGAPLSAGARRQINEEGAWKRHKEAIAQKTYNQETFFWSNRRSNHIGPP